jgi:hypothetical protein
MESTNLMPHMELPTLYPWSSSLNWYFHFHITQDFGKESKLLKYDLQLPYQPIPNSIIVFKRTYCNMMRLPIYIYKIHDKRKYILLPLTHPYNVIVLINVASR